MSDDIVKRLRGWADADEKSIELFGQMMREAADRIEALEAALRELLHQLDTDDVGGLVEGAMAAATRALEGKPHD